MAPRSGTATDAVTARQLRFADLAAGGIPPSTIASRAAAEDAMDGAAGDGGRLRAGRLAAVASGLGITQAAQGFSDFVEDRRIIDGRRRLESLPSAIFTMVLRRISCPTFVFGRRSTTATSLNAATGLISRARASPVRPVPLFHRVQRPP